MDIKNPANIQTKIAAKQDTNNQNAPMGASSDFLIRTMREDLDALSKNIQSTSLKLKPARQGETSLAPHSAGQIYSAPKPAPPAVNIAPPTRFTNASAKAAAPPDLPIAQEPLKPAPAAGNLPTPLTPNQPNSKPIALTTATPEPALGATQTQIAAGPFANKTILAIGALITAIGLLGAAGWFLWNKRQNPPLTSSSPSPAVSTTAATPKSSTAPTPSPSASQTPAAKPIFNADKQEIIVLQDGQENLIAQEIAKRLNATGTPKDTFTELLFRPSKNNSLSLTDLAGYLPTNILELTEGQNARLKNYIDINHFSLLLYSQAPLSSSPFTGNTNQNKVVLAAALAPDATSTQAIADLGRILSKNEPLLQKTLTKLLPPNAAQITDGKFSTNNYKNINIRYLNFDSAAETSIDYAVLNGVLLIGTSKESMLAAIDKIIAK